MPVSRLPQGDREGTTSLATTLLLASSAMMFGGLVLLFLILRADAPRWPPSGIRDVPRLLPTAATAAIFASSLTMELGVRALRRARLRDLSRWLLGTLALGAVFVALQATLWTLLLVEGFTSRNPYGGMFYVMTGFHCLHVAIALALLAWLIHGVRRGRHHGRDTVAVRMVGRFWHFLGAGWGLIYLALFGI